MSQCSPAGFYIGLKWELKLPVVAPDVCSYEQSCTQAQSCVSHLRIRKKDCAQGHTET